MTSGSNIPTNQLGVGPFEEDLTTVSFKDTTFLQLFGLHEHNALQYFALSPQFYDKNSINERIAMQTRFNQLEAAQLDFRAMTGIEYSLGYFTYQPSLFVINKHYRHSPTKTDLLAVYYIVEGSIYQAPDLFSLISNRLLTSIHHVSTAFSNISNEARFDPSSGYRWSFEEQQIAAALKAQMKNRGRGINSNSKSQIQSEGESQSVGKALAPGTMTLNSTTTSTIIPNMKTEDQDTAKGMDLDMDLDLGFGSPVKNEFGNDEKVSAPIPTKSISRSVFAKQEGEDMSMECLSVDDLNRELAGGFEVGGVEESFATLGTVESQSAAMEFQMKVDRLLAASLEQGTGRTGGGSNGENKSGKGQENDGKLTLEQLRAAAKKRLEEAAAAAAAAAEKIAAANAAAAKRMVPPAEVTDPSRMAAKKKKRMSSVYDRSVMSPSPFTPSYSSTPTPTPGPSYSGKVSTPGRERKNVATPGVTGATRVSTPQNVAARIASPIGFGMQPSSSSVGAGGVNGTTLKRRKSTVEGAI
ncbi:Mediator of RNA polymerase II transcription subunit 6 [Blyttiomyces sp. JEL0837]|nr:Mediator of RNA polymerase II transcription subunit 6 [Blyttiomyces sp. JEL0837]